MPTIRYNFYTGAPSKEPGLYKSCLGSTRDISIRWWDGSLWWDLSVDRGQKAKPFVWPTGKQMREIKPPEWFEPHLERLALRKITDQSKVRWGVEYKHYNPNEVLAYLIKKGVLPKNWREAFQEEMQKPKAKATTEKL